MRDIVKNKFLIILICATLVILIFAGVYNKNSEKIPFLENTVGIIIKPFQAAITYTVNGVGGFFKKFDDIKILQQENSQLKDEINVLNDKLRQYQDLKVENERLQSLLDLKTSNGDFEYLAANIIARDYGGWFETFTINKGIKDGVEKYDTVVTTEGLVGNVTELGENYSRVISIIDSTSSVGAEISRTKEIVIIDGDINLMPKGLCKLSYASKQTNVISGDLLETSGLGDVYPKGILIGKVLEVKDNSKDGYIIVEPAVDFEKINEVLIITGEK